MISKYEHDRNYYKALLDECGGLQYKAAEFLGICRKSMWLICQKYNLQKKNITRGKSPLRLFIAQYPSLKECLLAFKETKSYKFSSAEERKTALDIINKHFKTREGCKNYAK